MGGRARDSGHDPAYHRNWAEGAKAGPALMRILGRRARRRSIGKTANTPNLFDDLIRPREKLRRNRQSDLFRRLQVDDKLKLRRLLHRQISRFGAFQESCPRKQRRLPIEVIVVRPVGHETALIDKLLLKVNSRQAVFAGKLDDPLSFGEKAATGGRHNRAHLLLLCGLKGAL